MRLDRFLWFARFARSRPVAQSLAESGAIRVDGRRADRAHTLVRVGAVLTMMVGSNVKVVRILALPLRRGPAFEAAGLYQDVVNEC